ncbi:MAG: diguanylate cyclase [Ruminococcaceae bacterium]|nr:diguanylate cyclase [Oscillospiraceae bacterium]
MWSISNTAEILFNYVRDILYNPTGAALNLDDLDADYRKLGQGLQYLAQCVAEQRELAQALAKGNLSVKLPPPGNELAAPLKALHAALKHMTWQSQEVAKGNYQHRLDFMGEFAAAFNTMVEQLDGRQKALMQEIENTRRKTLALEQSNSLLESLTENMAQWVIVTDVFTKERLFINSTAVKAFREAPALKTETDHWIDGRLDSGAWKQQLGEVEAVMVAAGKTCYFSVGSYPLQWHERRAVAHVFANISADKERFLLLEKHAYRDNLTKTHNRYSGMQILRQWLEEEKHFSLCFADLDNLKYVNDNFGHSEGDQYIIKTAEVLSGFSGDVVVSRLGGDEFMLLAPGMGLAQAEQRMLELRDALLTSGAPDGPAYTRSISFGVVEAKPGCGLSASELLSIADERMYAFKRAHKGHRTIIT